MLASKEKKYHQHRTTNKVPSPTEWATPPFFDGETYIAFGVHNLKCIFDFWVFWKNTTIIYIYIYIYI